MSTILKSLKKLEQAKEAGQYTGPIAEYRGPGSVSMHGAKHRWIKSVWFRRSLVTLIILGLGISSIYFYSQSQNGQHQAGTEDTPPPPLTAKLTAKRPKQKAPMSDVNRSAKLKARKTPVTIQKPMTKARSPKVVKRPPTTQRQIQFPPVSNTPRTESPSTEQRPSISRGDRRAESAESGVRKATNSNSAQRPKTPAPAPIRTIKKPPPSAQTAVKKVKRKPAEAPAESFQNVTALTDGRLKVQAIVWSRIPEDRMTVINSRVLHEGDTVDGFTLIVIRSDDVVVKESGGARWKVLFGRP